MSAQPEHAVMLNTMAEHAAEALYVMDSEGRVVFMNPAAERMFGWRRDEAVGQVLHDLVHFRHTDGRPFPMTECPLGAVMRTGSPARDHEDAFIHRHGHWVPVLCSNAPVTEGGVLTGAVLIVHDLTERHAREREAKRRAEFDQLLLGIVSHDLRTPLGAITMGAATLMRKELDERSKATVARIIASAGRAERMLRELLDFTQARVGGGIPVEPASMDLATTLQEIAAEVGLGHFGRTIDVTTEGDCRGHWDADRLVQVVTNLIENALAHGDAERAVTVRAAGSDSEVTLTVHNYGEPIPADLLPRIFQPLQRGSRGPVAHAKRSVGLGLYIVRHLVEAHGGTVEVSSGVAEGTTFRVRLPRRSALRSL